MEYESQLLQRFWSYRDSEFAGQVERFDRKGRNGRRPPVFAKDHFGSNLLLPPGADAEYREKLFGLMPSRLRQRWYGSMKSSQALAQSLFGNLFLLGRLGVLGRLHDGGVPVFVATDRVVDFGLERTLDPAHLGEIVPTSLDAFLLYSNGCRVAVECKFAEDEFSPCTRTTLSPGSGRYRDEFCEGSYTKQRGRHQRCSLTEVGIRYWKFIPGLFNWDSMKDHAECPLRACFQLVRAVLAACVDEQGRLAPGRGHAVLLYDERNPAFALRGDGAGRRAYNLVKSSLHNPSRLRQCSWQQITRALRGHDDLRWMAQALTSKYGFGSAGL